MEAGEEKIKSCFHFRALLGHVCFPDRQGMQQKLFIEMWLIIDIYFAGNWERAALAGSGGWEGSRAGGQNLLFPRKLLALLELPAQSGMEGAALPWGEERRQGTRWG